MYVPAHFAMEDDAVRQLLAGHGAADLVTSTPKGLLSTLLPFWYDQSAGPYGSLLGHVARNNEQWRTPVIGEAMVLFRGPDGYVSPSWYPAKAEHGRVVPTWNYVSAQVFGELRVHDDQDWVGRLVRRLTDRHEQGFAHPWSADDAPAEYLAGQLRAIVGLELVITRIEAKAKLSQNRSRADREGVIEGQRARGQVSAAAAVQAADAVVRSAVRSKLTADVDPGGRRGQPDEKVGDGSDGPDGLSLGGIAMPRSAAQKASR